MALAEKQSMCRLVAEVGILLVPAQRSWFACSVQYAAFAYHIPRYGAVALKLQLGLMVAPWNIFARVFNGLVYA